MLTLGIESATDHGAVALSKGTQLLGQVSFAARMGQAEKLVPAIDALLQLHCVKQSDVRLIAVGTGPGSFTGLRIGMATAKGLAQALGIPLVGVPTADTFAARGALTEEEQCIVMGDRRNLVYTAFFENNIKKIAEESQSIESLIGLLRQRYEKILCIGTGAEEHREKLAALSHVKIAPAALNLPSALEIARLGFERFMGTQQDELFMLEPFYVQRVMAAVTTSV
jgi:tRNA threonylcarbamoyladenosine biosynthesis protein TsaB